MELGLSLGEAPSVPPDAGRAAPELGLGLGVGIGASAAAGTGRGSRAAGTGTGTGWWASALPTPEPAVRLSLVSSSLGLQWPPLSDGGICHAGPGRAEAPPVRGFDVNWAPSVAASALALEDDEEDPAAAALSSSPNDSAGSFPLDLGGPHAHAEGAAATQAGCCGGGGERSSSRASDEDEGASARKKLRLSKEQSAFLEESLRLSKEQSAFLEESFKEHSTLNPSIKSINGKSPIVVGPWGGTGGYPWDDGVYSTIRQIVIGHGAAIDSIRIEYDLKGRSVWSETHGGTDGGSETDKVKLDCPDEVLVSVSGHYGSVCGTPVIIRSLTFQSNSSTYGPFGTEDGTPFSLPVSSGKVIGFHGRSGSYLNSIGFYLKQVHFPNPMNTPASPMSLPSSQSRNSYGFTGGDTGPDMVLAVRDRGDSYAVYASNQPKQQYTNPSPDYNDGALWNQMVSFPSHYGDTGAAAVSSPQTYGPWGGSGGTIFDDGVYTGVWQINLTRAVGISSIKVLYDRNGQAVWGNKHGFSGGVIPDKIIFDFPSEVLTHITGFYDSAIIMGPTVVRSLTFHTNKRTYGPYGDEYGTYFSTNFTNGRIVGFHGREGWYIDGIGVHVQEGKLASQRFVSRPKTATSPSVHYNMLAQAPSNTYTDNEVASYGMVKEPVPMGPGPWGGEGGRAWDDGVYTGVKQIYIMRGAFVGSIQIEYDRSGHSIWSSRHGNSGHITHRVKLDFPHEVLTCVYGYYNTNREDGPRVLRSLTFITNRGKYGPFGDEFGAYFSSATTEGKVVGFHGRSGQHLDAIGVHMQHWLGDRRPAPKYVLSKYLF